MPENDKERMSAIRPTSLTEEDVIDIRNRNRWGESVQNLSLLYGVGLTTIRDVLSGKTWAEVEQPGNLPQPSLRLEKMETVTAALHLLHSPSNREQGLSRELTEE